VNGDKRILWVFHVCRTDDNLYFGVDPPYFGSGINLQNLELNHYKLDNGLSAGFKIFP